MIRRRSLRRSFSSSRRSLGPTTAASAAMSASMPILGKVQRDQKRRALPVERSDIAPYPPMVVPSGIEPVRFNLDCRSAATTDVIDQGSARMSRMTSMSRVERAASLPRSSMWRRTRFPPANDQPLGMRDETSAQPAQDACSRASAVSMWATGMPFNVSRSGRARGDATPRHGFWGSGHREDQR